MEEEMTKDKEINEAWKKWAENKTDWTSVRERLPEADTKVLALCAGTDFVYTATFIPESGWVLHTYCEELIYQKKFTDKRYVSFWKEIGELPKPLIDFPHHLIKKQEEAKP